MPERKPIGENRQRNEKQKTGQNTPMLGGKGVLARSCDTVQFTKNGLFFRHKTGRWRAF